MKHAQVINLNQDTVLAFDGANVINDTDQLTLGIDKGILSINVDVGLWDLMADNLVSVTNVQMTYNTFVDYWVIYLYDLIGILADRHKYVGIVAQSAGETANMRNFKILEFCVDNDSLESTLMSMPYEVVISGGEAYMIWYQSDVNIGDLAYAKYKAPAYEGGVGITYATDASRVTHRGAVIVYA